MSLTLELLRLIGSPFVSKTLEMDWDEIFELYRYAVKNRMSFLYLEARSRQGNLGKLETLYDKERIRYLETLEAIYKVSKVLTDSDIQHAIFKTLRPYRFNTVDIDSLVFGHRNDYLRAIRSMEKAGYEMLLEGPRSTTLRDPRTKLGVDLYEQVAVSFISYMDKEKLVDFVTTVELPNGNYVKALKPEADLAAIIAHGIVKEQMYTLSEYYTYIHYLKQLKIDDFVQIVKQNNITSATRTHTALTALLHKAAHKTVPNGLQQILNDLGEETFETTLLIQNKFETPYKYRMLTVARSLLELTKDKKCRSSIPTQILHMLDLEFTKDFLRDLMKHMVRETY